MKQKKKELIEEIEYLKCELEKTKHYLKVQDMLNDTLKEQLSYRSVGKRFDAEELIMEKEKIGYDVLKAAANEIKESLDKKAFTSLMIVDDACKFIFDQGKELEIKPQQGKVLVDLLIKYHEYRTKE